MAVKQTIISTLTSYIILLIWIYAVEGASLSIACTLDNCTSTQHTYCKEGFCTCIPGFKDKGHYCQLRTIGEDCSNDTDCIGVAKSQCLNDTCQCAFGYLPKDELKECALRQIGDMCDNDYECSTAIANSTCGSDGKCRCPSGFLLKGSLCVARKLGDDCDNKSDCTEVMTYTRCYNHKCSCVNLYIQEDHYTCRLRRLGDSCTRNVECNKFVNETRICNNNKLCECANGYKRISNITVGDPYCVKLKLGDPCSKPADCSSVPLSVCNEKKICQCKIGRKPSDDNQTCEVRQLHDMCSNNADCQHVNYSACVDSKCSCIAVYKEHQSEDAALPYCEKKVIGDSCLSDIDCGITNSFCKNGICECIRKYSYQNESSQCIEMFLDETECTTTEECIEHYNNTVCLDGLCQCQKGYYLDASRHECLFRYVGDSCQTRDECEFSVPNSDCVSGLCQCKTTHIPSADRMSCTIKRLGGMRCRYNNDCELRVPHSSCDVDNSSTCYCNIGYYSNEKFDSCIEKQLKDPCSLDEQCNTTNPNAFCSPLTQRCECLPEFVATFQNGPDLLSPVSSFSKPFCARRIIGDQSCVRNEECTQAIANSICGVCDQDVKDSKCSERCKAVDVLSGYMTASNISNGTTDCHARTCLCEKGFASRFDGTRCESIKLREPCQDDGDCTVHTANSVCLMIRKICFCASGFQEEGTDVCKRRIIGDLCARPSDCSDAVTFSHCKFSRGNTQHGVCTCNSGYHVNNTNTECRKRQIGDRTCALDTDCSDAVNNSYCHHGMCVCLLGYFRSYDHTQCYKRRLHSDYCDTDLECSAVINNSVCESYRCVCSSGYYDENDECVRRNINDNCTINSDCSNAVNRSICVNGICMCVSGYVARSDDLCVKRRVFDSACENNHDCADAVENSNCNNGTCECNSGYYPSDDNNICLQRKLDDACNTSSDCDSVIRNSDCISGQCTCIQGFDAFANNSQCVASPTYIGHLCYFTEQCQKIDNVSTCNLTHGINSTCVCPPGTFPARNRTACIKFPAAIGEYCFLDYHCQQRITNSFCDVSSCNCSSGYFADINNTVCHRDPEKLGDYCQESSHCLENMQMSKCEPENNTCVCEYGYTQATSRLCVERNILPQHSPFVPPTTAVCQNRKCSNLTNSRCVTPPGTSEQQCRCDFRHARAYNSNQCVPIQTYEFDLILTKEAGRYDYIPINATREGFTDRITLSGLMTMFDESPSPLRDRYVSSEVTHVEPLDKSKQWTDEGVIARILLHLTANYLDATPISDIYNFIENNLNRSDGVLGRSALKVATPFAEAIVFRDYDECAQAESNDCSPYATCINTLGSFMCVCNSRFEDVSRLLNRRPGRECVIPTTTDSSSDLCSSDDCQTRWEFVGLAVTLFLLIVLAFITYEIIQRKQTFTARKLYEKFGTTKIKKLQQASMKRLQERKKRKKEESKKQKEEEKQKKEELKREKSEKRKRKEEEKKAKPEDKKQHDLEKAGKKGQRKEKPDDDDVEWLDDGADTDIRPPSPVETMHPPSLPFATTADESPVLDISSLPGSVNTPDIEMGYTRRVVSPIEESPV